MSKKLSVDELMARSKAVRNGETMMKAAKPAGSFSEEARSMRFIMSAEVQDRDGDVIMINGIDTEQFEKNAVALWGHNHGLITGGWQDISKISGRPKRMEGTHVWAEAGTSPEVDKTFNLARQGFLKACSIGFMVNWSEAEGIFDDNDDFTGIKFNQTQLLECSLCSIPANQVALAKMAESDEGRRLATEILEMHLDAWPKTAAGVYMTREDYAAFLKPVTAEKTVHSVITPENEPGLFARIGKFFNLKPAEKQADPEPAVGAEPPAPELPKLATAEEKAAAQALAEAVVKRAEKLKA